MCWRVKLRATEELPQSVRNLETITLSGPALATLLKTGSLIYMREGQWVNHEFDVPQASSLPREFRESIVLVEAYRELVPRALKEMQVPGSYLVKREEQWIVSPNFQSDCVVWSAQSDISGKTYKGTSFTVPIFPGTSLEHTTDTVVSSIVKNFPSDSIIKDLHALTEHIRDMLRSQGYRSERLYEIEVSGDGDRVKFVAMHLTSESSRTEIGYIDVSEGMDLDTVYEGLREAVSAKLGREDFELESPDELRESLLVLLQRLAAEQDWAPPEEDTATPVLDSLTVALEHGRVVEEVKELRRTGMSQQALGVIDGLLEKVQPALQDNPALISSYVAVLLLKVEVVVSGEIAGTIDSVKLLNVLDQIEEYLYHFEIQVLQSRTRLGKEIRWALALRESLRKNL
ncbi:MAG: hypothetical protein ACTSR9_13535 [Candidatus Thorarchaeota archaeon]